MKMTGNSCLLDTSVIIHVFKNNTPVIEKLEAIENIYVTTIVTGELYFGAYASVDPSKHFQQIQGFLQHCKIIYPDYATSATYGQIKANLKKKGKPIPENDIWIAAVALQSQLPLFTTDKHFGEISGIVLL
jgi:tRNA(fMet)-specific endonuclease VapC